MLLRIKWSNIECFLVKLTGIYSKVKNTVTAVVSEEKYCDTVSVVEGGGVVNKIVYHRQSSLFELATI